MLKSAFVSIYILVLHCTLGFGIYLGLTSEFGLTSVGLLVSSLPGVLVFDILLAFKPVARTSRHLHSVSFLTSMGLAILIYGIFQQAILNPIALCLTIFSVVGWFIYDYWFSIFKNRDSQQLQKGQQFPNLRFQTTDGDEIQSNEFLGAPCVYLFYRGNWCPLCMAQIREFAQLYQKITESGANIVLISPQPEKNTQGLAKKFQVPFIFLIDKGGQAAKQLNIEAKNGLPLGMQVFGYDSDTILPTLIVTDKQGRILFADLTDNYRVRPEPQTIIDILATNSA